MFTEMASGSLSILIEACGLGLRQVDRHADGEQAAPTP